jgi:hypothetical protein
MLSAKQKEQEAGRRGRDLFRQSDSAAKGKVLAVMMYTLILLQIPPNNKHSLAIYTVCYLLDSAITLKFLERTTALG